MSLKNPRLYSAFSLLSIIFWTILFPVKSPVWGDSSLSNHQVQIKITFQNPNFRNPWRSTNPSIRYATGTYIGKNRVLVPAHLLSYSTLIEARSLEETASISGEIIRLDYESDLAMIQFLEPKKLFSNISAVSFDREITANREVSLLRLDHTGSPDTLQGKLENILVGAYPSGNTELPYVEFSSSEKLSGNGELVRDSKNPNPALGILNEYNSHSQQGRVIPGEIINQFLDSKNNYSYKGFYFRPITDDTTRNYYGIPDRLSGVMVSDTFLGSSADKYLKSEDIITEVGGYSLDGKGQIQHSKHGKISFSYLWNDPKFLNEKSIPLKIIRNKKIIDIDLPLLPFPETSVLIPHNSPRGMNPGYMIMGGLLFIELNEFYLREFGRAWRSSVDKKMLYLLDYHKFRKKENDPKRLVYLVQVLADEGNNGYEDRSRQRLISINGSMVMDLSHLYSLFNESKSKYIELEMEDGSKIVFDRRKLDETNRRILENYRILSMYIPSSYHETPQRAMLE